MCTIVAGGSGFVGDGLVNKGLLQALRLLQISMGTSSM